MSGRYRIAIAARFGDVRLIDNADLVRSLNSRPGDGRRRPVSTTQEHCAVEERMGHDRRADAAQQMTRDAECDPHARQHHDEADVAGATDRIDMSGAEQQPLDSDREHCRQATAQSAQHDATKDHLLHDRRGDHRSDDERHDVRSIERRLVDRFGVARDRYVQRHDDRRRDDLRAERPQPDHRTPTQIRPLRSQPDVVSEPPGAPSAAGVPTPPHRWGVADDAEQRNVRGNRPLEVDDEVEEVFRRDERRGEHEPPHRQRPRSAASAPHRVDGSPR